MIRSAAFFGLSLAYFVNRTLVYSTQVLASAPSAPVVVLFPDGLRESVLIQRFGIRESRCWLQLIETLNSLRAHLMLQHRRWMGKLIPVAELLRHHVFHLAWSGHLVHTLVTAVMNCLIRIQVVDDIWYDVRGAGSCLRFALVNFVEVFACMGVDVVGVGVWAGRR